MRHALAAVVLAAATIVPVLASAQGVGPRQRYRDMDITGSIGRAPWQQPWQYDTDSYNDNRPELRPYQQSGGQQTGGPARNLIPDDGLHLFPR